MWRKALKLEARALLTPLGIACSGLFVASSACSESDGLHLTAASRKALTAHTPSATDLNILENTDCCAPSFAKPIAIPITRLPPDDLKALISQLRSCVTEDAQIITTDYELEPYGRDAYSYHSGLPPDVVVLPKNTQEVSAIVKICNEKGVAVVARGGGTSLEGHTTTPYRGVCVDLSGMDAIVAIRPGDMDATVQCGVRWQDLNKVLHQYGLFFAMDPGPGATIGGMCGTGCSGTNAVRYGTMKANVVSLTVVLADGSVLKTSSRARKSTAGYDITSLFIGSEGTLGIVTEATIKLNTVPPELAVAACSFPTIDAASAAVADLMRAGVQVGAVELLDANMISIVNSQSGFNYEKKPHVFFKFTGSRAKVDDDARVAEQITKKHSAGAFEWTLDDVGKEKLWEARKVALWSAGAMDPSRRVITTDVCVPISEFPRLMSEMEKLSAASFLQVSAVGHCGDGNAHHFILFDPTDANEVAEAKRLNEALVKLAIGMDGTCTGEHGVGVGKTKYLKEEFDAAAISLMHTLKRSLDPKNILNPGKKLPPLA